MDEGGKKDRLFKCLAKLIPGIAAAIGSNCEVVLHDFSNPEQSIVAIENGHVTGRKVGDPLDVLGFQILHHPPEADLINYRTELKGQKTLRSSSIFLRDENQVFGAICINYDITAFLAAQRFLEDIVVPSKAGIQEDFERNVDEVFDRLIKDAIRTTGKEVADMDREDKVLVISYLESKGAFLIRYSVERTAALLNVSKYTVYNYLEEVKTRQDGVPLSVEK